MSVLDYLFRPMQPVPARFTKLFTHLNLDVVWFGILSGSTLSFLSIYTTRLGGTPVQIALISAAPALVNMTLALPIGNWLGTKPSVAKAVFWGGLFSRFFYLPMVLLPWFFPDSVEITIILTIILVMNIPGTIMVVGFTALFGETVPPEWRGHVAGTRNGLLSIFTFLTNLACGLILDKIPFPMGYQVVFMLGFLGAMVSSYHVWHIRPLGIYNSTSVALPGVNPPAGSGNALLRKLVEVGKMARFDVLRGHYGKVVVLLFFFHLLQFLPIPLFPIYQVNVLHFPDQTISMGIAVFNLTVFLGSTQLARFVHRWGNHKVFGWGAVFLCAYSILMTFSYRPIMLIVTSFIGGLAFAMVSGALFNYLLEYATDQDRPVYLAWYNVGLNAAVLIGSLGGAVIADRIGIGTAMVLFGIGRIIVGIAILLWG